MYLKCVEKSPVRIVRGSVIGLDRVSVQLRSAPFDDGKAVAFEGRKLLRRNVNRLVKRLPRHKHAEHTVGGGSDGQRGVVGVGIGLEGDEVIRIAFHVR